MPKQMEVSIQTLTTRIQYAWRPFHVRGLHLCFSGHASARLSRAACSWWGPAIYKWEGRIASGPHAGKRGLLIGETGDLRQRIKQYVAGTQPRGNKLWRDTFLKLGSIDLYTLQLESFAVDGGAPVSPDDVFASNNLRLVLEQLLVMEVRAKQDPGIWLVNARQ